MNAPKSALGRIRSAWRRGSAVVEFALVTPTLVILFAGLIEYGRVYKQMSQLQVITNDAARAGASVPASEDPGLKAEAKAHEILWSYDIRCIYCVSATVTDSAVDSITVVVRQPYISILGLVPTPQWIETESTVMMWEQI
jgi:hypothetical protein